jgi:hypothetical protein
MKDYQNKLVPINTFVELAKKAKAQDEEWVQRAVLALTVAYTPGLANALLMKLRLQAVIEELDPFPFDTPTEEEFA